MDTPLLCMWCYVHGLATFGLACCSSNHFQKGRQREERPQASRRGSRDGAEGWMGKSKSSEPAFSHFQPSVQWWRKHRKNCNKLESNSYIKLLFLYLAARCGNWAFSVLRFFTMGGRPPTQGVLRYKRFGPDPAHRSPAAHFHFLPS